MMFLIAASLLLPVAALNVKESAAPPAAAPAAKPKYCPNLSKMYSNVGVRTEVGTGIAMHKNATQGKQQAMASWFASACPWEETRHSGFFVRDKHAQEAKDFANAFQCDGAGGQLSSDMVLQKFKNTRLVFAGDSVMRQFSQAMMCHFQEHFVKDTMEWNQWPLYADAEQCANKPGSKKYQNCKMMEGCAMFKHGVEVCYALHASCAAVKAGEAIKHLKTDSASKNILVLGSGHHKQCEDHDWEALQHKPPTFPKNTKVVYSDFTPQHFSESPDGHYVGASKQECKASVTEGTARQVEVAKAVPVIQSLGWSRLETFRVNQENGKFHSSLAGVGGKEKDCTHWMMPGMPDVWTKLLIQQLYETI